MQKLEELLDMLVPGGRHQHDVTMLEDSLVEACDRARQAHSQLGQLLDGPPEALHALHAGQAGQAQPACAPVLWKHDQLAKKKLAWRLPNNRHLTTSCMQVSLFYTACSTLLPKKSNGRFSCWPLTEVASMAEHRTGNGLFLLYFCWSCVTKIASLVLCLAMAASCILVQATNTVDDRQHQQAALIVP